MTEQNSKRFSLPTTLLFSFIPAILMTAGISAQAQQDSQGKGNANAGAKVLVPLELPAGTPLEIGLDHRVPIKSKGEPVEGVLLHPLFAFDRLVAPAGSTVEGRLAAIEDAPLRKRARAMMRGNFSPLRSAQVEFYSLDLKDGRHIPIKTAVTDGEPEVVKLETASLARRKKQSAASRVIGSARRNIHAEKKRLVETKDQVLKAIESPGRARRLKRFLMAQLPYQRPYLEKGTRYMASLKAPIQFGSEEVPVSHLKKIGSLPPAGSIVNATLLTSLSSATTHLGAPVEAMVTRPVFSKEHQLVIPEGSMVTGKVVQVKPATRLHLHRDGLLRLSFDKIQPPHAAPEYIEGSLAGVEVSKSEGVKLDNEGGARATTSKMAYAAPAIDVLIATTTAMPDRDVRPGRVYTDTHGPADQQILGGGIGYKLVGAAIALGIRSRPVTAALAIYGAAWSVYSNLLTRGQNVVFPKNTAMQISFGKIGPHRPNSMAPGPKQNSPQK